MSEIEVKNVKFGDCSIIKHTDSFCIVDCGSSNRSDALDTYAFPYSMVKNDLQSQNFSNKSLLITHFDKDHISGISMMKDKIFDNIYFPICIINEESIEKGSKLGKPVSRLLILASKRSKGFSLGKCIIDFLINLENIVKNNSGLIPLRSGDQFSFGGHEHTVLWPEREKSSYNILAIDFFKDIFQANYEDLFVKISEVEDCKAINQNLSLYFENVIDYYLCYLEKLSDDSISSKYSSIRGQLENDNIINHNNLSEHLDNPLELLKASYQMILKANAILWEKIDTTSELALQIKSISRQQYHHFIKTMNALSIIFHENNAQYIFLGDAPIDIIEHVARRNDKFTFFNRYKVVKIQHHGTQPYFTEELPTADNYIISNGGFKNRPVGIDTLSLIRQRALNDPNVQIFCTNSHLAPDFYCSINCCYDFCTKIKTSHSIKL